VALLLISLLPTLAAILLYRKALTIIEQISSADTRDSCILAGVSFTRYIQWIHPCCRSRLVWILLWIAVSLLLVGVYSLRGYGAMNNHERLLAASGLVAGVYAILVPGLIAWICTGLSLIARCRSRASGQQFREVPVWVLGLMSICLTVGLPFFVVAYRGPSEFALMLTQMVICAGLVLGGILCTRFALLAWQQSD
jgi:hypothetical protein